MQGAASTRQFCSKRNWPTKLRSACGSPVYTLTSIIIDKLAGIQLLSVQSKGGSRSNAASVEQKPLVNSGNIAEGRKILAASGRRWPGRVLYRCYVDNVPCSHQCSCRRQQEGKKELPARCILALSDDEETDGQTVYSNCGVFDVSQLRTTVTECQDNGRQLQRITNMV